MRPLDPSPIIQKPNISKPPQQHKDYPYMLGVLEIDKPIRSAVPM